MNRLKELRKDKKISQTTLAKLLNVNEKTISRWENGESQIKPGKAEKLANYFKVNVGYLLGYDDKPYKPLHEFVNELREQEELEKSFTAFLDFLYKNKFRVSDNKILLLFNTLLSVDDNKGDKFNYNRLTNPKNNYSLMEETKERNNK